MIYYVEDTEAILNLVIYTLNATGYEARGFREARSFWRGMEETLADCIILDIMLPDESGVQILEALRRDPKTVGIPVIMLSAKGEESDKVESLELGADDYVTKPFGMMELLARVKAVLRRSQAERDASGLSVGGIQMDRERHTVRANGQSVYLTFREFELLRFLMENEGRAFDRDKLLDEVWGVDYVGGARTVDMHIQTLRKKLGPCAHQIETIYGLGYKIGGAEA